MGHGSIGNIRFSIVPITILADDDDRFPTRSTLVNGDSYTIVWFLTTRIRRAVRVIRNCVMRVVSFVTGCFVHGCSSVPSRNVIIVLAIIDEGIVMVVGGVPDEVHAIVDIFTGRLADRCTSMDVLFLILFLCNCCMVFSDDNGDDDDRIFRNLLIVAVVGSDDDVVFIVMVFVIRSDMMLGRSFRMVILMVLFNKDDATTVVVVIVHQGEDCGRLFFQILVFHIMDRILTQISSFDMVHRCVNLLLMRSIIVFSMDFIMDDVHLIFFPESGLSIEVTFFVAFFSRGNRHVVHRMTVQQDFQSKKEEI